MEKPKKELRVPMMMQTEMVERIDTYRFANRIATRAEAMRRLIVVALEKEMPVSAGE